MKQLSLPLIALLLGCGGSSYVHSDATLGRVIIYRSGVAYFERSADIADDHLDLSVPTDKVDDFLKSLRIADASTGAAAPVAFPTASYSPETGLIDMRIRLPGAGPHRITLSYVTEAPAWKPSYRVAIEKTDQVKLEGFAIIDNTSGEDWKDIKLGVASSSALSFRFDLRSVRQVPRETLQATDQFAVAPPLGGATFGAQAPKQELAFDLSDEDLGSSALYLTPAERRAESAGHLGRIEQTVATVQRLLESARSQRDVVKTLCLNDKLTQLGVAVRSARERQASLESAGARNDADVAGHELTILKVLRQRAEQLGAEANQCVGEEAGFVGETAVTVQVDRDIAPGPDYPGEKHETAPSGSAASTPPPVATPKPNPAPAPTVDTKRRTVSTEQPPAERGKDVDELADRIKNRRRRVVVEGYAGDRDADKYASSLDRASKVRDRLIARGVDPDSVAAVGNGQRAGHGAGVRIVEIPGPAEASLLRDSVLAGRAQEATEGEPIGSGHFESASPMSVASGSSTMIPIFKVNAQGSFVYLYDRESARGSERYPFRAVRFKNPTSEALESGPVAVFGDGRFIGEGLCEPIPAHSVAFVPFALDRQIVVDYKETERDDITRILTAQRGVFTAEVVHTRRAAVTLHNRVAEAATVYVRHTAAPGYELGKAPASRERIGGAYLFRAELPASGEVEVIIEEGAPQSKIIDVRTAAGMDLLRAYLATGADAALKEGMSELLEQTKEITEVEERITTTRSQMKELKDRMEELERQVVTLRAVKGASGDPRPASKAAGTLLDHLEKKLRETSDRLSQATVDLVGLEERLMNARIAREAALSTAAVAPAEKK